MSLLLALPGEQTTDRGKHPKTILSLDLDPKSSWHVKLLETARLLAYEHLASQTLFFLHISNLTQNSSLDAIIGKTCLTHLEAAMGFVCCVQPPNLKPLLSRTRRFGFLELDFAARDKVWIGSFFAPPDKDSFDTDLE